MHYSFSGSVFAVGILGEDKGALNLKQILEENNVNTEGMFCDKNRKTITKTRVIAGGRATVSQQVVRIDRECNEVISEIYEKELMNYIKMVMPQMQGVVMSDYGSGTITPKIRDLILSLSKEYDIPSIIDSRYAIFNFVGTDYVKQNDAELASAVGYKIDNEDSLYKAAQEFLVKMQAKGIYY